MSAPATAVEHLVKTYPRGRKARVAALSDVSFEVHEGEIFGLIGPDGAGKTSLFRILVTVLLADSGAARVLGLDVVKDYAEIRKRIGYMPGRFSLYQDLTVRENLEFFATVFDTTIRANYELVKDIYEQIEPFADRRAGKLSGGMKQKLALSCALIHRPSVLFLDEPTTGVDAVSRKEFWEMLGRLKRQGITILVSTPYMDEASLCDRVALIQGGKILQIAPPAEITAKFPKQVWAVRAPQMVRLLDELERLPGVHAYPFGQFHHVVMPKGDDGRARLEGLSAGHPDIELGLVAPDIEDVFMDLMRAS